MPSGPSSYQIKLERVLNDFDSHQEKRLSILGIQLKQQQDEVINKINIIWKEKGGEEFSGSETVIREGESRDIKQDNPDDRAYGDTKKAEEVEEESEESEVEEAGEWMEYEEPFDLVDTRNMSHVMDFTILENIDANIDPSLSQVVFGRPFVEITKLISDREQGLITFTDEIKEITFKTPYKDPKMDDLTRCESTSDLESGFYMDLDKLDPSYKEETDRINLDGSFEVGIREVKLCPYGGGVLEMSKL
ncbi:hypothetical protein Tco_1441275 [Tanacetum coccineum]